ncbi:MAG: hypothetical protein ACRD0X_02750 [Thermoanaerobaculia bacterium]
MSKLVSLLSMALMLSGLATASAQMSPDSTVADPEVHQVAFENDHVRVLRALASPGHESAMHSHPPGLVISLGTGRVRLTQADGTQQILDVNPGTIFWIDSIEHSWELLAGEVNVVAVEVKAAKAPATN